jgi:hypothetical protein
MKSALILDEQSCQRSKPQEHPSISRLLSPTQDLTSEDISPKWALRLKSENMPTFMSLTWLRWNTNYRSLPNVLWEKHTVIKILEEDAKLAVDTSQV